MARRHKIIGRFTLVVILAMSFVVCLLAMRVEKGLTPAMATAATSGMTAAEVHAVLDAPDALIADYPAGSKLESWFASDGLIFVLYDSNGRVTKSWYAPDRGWGDRLRRFQLQSTRIFNPLRPR